MEQPTLVCDFLGVQQAAQNVAPTDSLTHSQPHAGIVAAGRHRPPLLRRISQSDPHMDVPRFLQASEKTFNNSLHHVLSGLFDSTTTLSKPFGASTETLNKSRMDSNFELQPPKSTLDRNRSALELTSAASSNSLCAEGEIAANPPLRKVSSTLGNFASIDHHHQNSPLHNSHHPHPPSALAQFSSHLWGGGSHHHDSITKIPEEDQGLMMSIRQPAASAASSLATTSAKGGILDSSTTSSSSTTSASSGSSAASSSPPRNPLGGVMGVFGRGFFAKPVMRSESENYRYIMALDR